MPDAGSAIACSPLQYDAGWRCNVIFHLWWTYNCTEGAYWVVVADMPTERFSPECRVRLLLDEPGLVFVQRCADVRRHNAMSITTIPVSRIQCQDITDAPKSHIKAASII